VKGDNDREFADSERVYLGRTRSPENERLHVERYRLAAAFVRQDHVVLDAACGSGYGTQLLADVAARVVGLDISAHAVDYALQHYSRPNVDYRRADLESPIALNDANFDVIVSFETLEHISNQRRLLTEFHRLLKTGGLLIMSTPDRDVFQQLAYQSAFHVHELSKLELTSLVGDHFKIVELYGQVPYIPVGWHKVVRLLASLDVFNLRSRLGKADGFLRKVRRAMVPIVVSEDGTNTVRITLNGNEHSHVYLIVVASKL